MANFTEKEKEKIYDYINWTLDDMDTKQLMEIAFEHFEKYYFSLEKEELINQNILTNKKKN
jgi:hypothetical protein